MHIYICCAVCSSPKTHPSTENTFRMSKSALGDSLVVASSLFVWNTWLNFFSSLRSVLGRRNGCWLSVSLSHYIEMYYRSLHLNMVFGWQLEILKIEGSCRVVEHMMLILVNTQWQRREIWIQQALAIFVFHRFSSTIGWVINWLNFGCPLIKRRLIFELKKKDNR